jgi:preprotein translocase subunit SecA
MSEEELKSQTNVLKQKLENGATEDDILADSFAVCREAADRVLGLRHFPVQIIGGIVLHQGRIAEMKTGEGKTLVETLPGYLNALSGKGVHIVTANDYLAKRDSDLMGKVYRFLGLTVGLIVPNMENNARRNAYLADITYATNNELGFDYLRDNMVAYKSQKVQRGHHYSIVDEVDSILIDEARTPLIISGPGDKSTDLYIIADNFVKTLKVMKIPEIDTKEDNEELFGDADYVVDEKAKTATLTQNGVKKAENYFKLENLTDPANVTIQHHINQALKAHGVMQRDIEYVIREDGVVIVDEFTGRLMFGRRYNDGLHQAIEAKEGVKIERESKTLATITFQNYFRLYKKLSGMTGTAMTEEPEFREIYKLDIIEIPTNRPLIRKDFTDSIFKTENGKFTSVIRDIEECHKNGQPVLVGTVSIEKSELLSKLLSTSGIKHAVLNAKYHEKEAEIIAQAGKYNAVTIATNMAGRGTDISLGGNAEYLAKSEMRRMQITEELISEASGFAETDNEEIINARKLYTDLIAKYKKITQAEAEKVREAGGLCIMGTERHESRRIDNQLRGRAGRQGDPGSSKFYLSTDDSLMRLFGGERMRKYMNMFHVEEDEALDDKMLSRCIESAQRAVEGRNFQARKSVLQYDDVLNKQRELIYAQRDKVLNGENLRDQIMVMLEQTVEQIVKRFLPGEDYQDHWNFTGLRDYFMGWLIKEDDLQFSQQELENLSPDYLTKEIVGIAKKLYEEREHALSPMLMREIERAILLRCVDTKWMDHIDAMDELKQGIRLRAYGQKDPVVEYRMEGFDMFDEMIASIREDTTRLLLTVKVVQDAPPPPRTDIPNPQNLTTSGGSEVNTSKTIKSGQKLGRNDLCTCGSGKKYKRCCGQDN